MRKKLREFSRFWGIASSLLALVVLVLPNFANAGSFGVGSYLGSEPTGDRGTIANQIGDLGMTIDREGFTYDPNPNFDGYDDALPRLQAKGVEILGLLGYSGNLPSVSDWTAYVDKVVSRYNDKITAWEIFNEEDHMSGGDYKPYLEASYNKIKSINGNAKVIVGGLTARTEAVPFWDALYSAGGWPFFDALGLHPYRDEAPEMVKFNVGDFKNSIELAAREIRKYGGGKKIWLTEFGVKSSTVGQEKQANYLVRSFILSRTVPEVEKSIMYRFRDDNESWGVVDSGLSKKTAFSSYQSIIPQLEGTGLPEDQFPFEKQTIDGFDSVSGWNTDSSNANLSVSAGDGYSGQGMKFDYQFTSGSAFAQASKTIPISGQPAGIGVWAKGPNSVSTLKIRIVDAKGETFQLDLGKVTNDWRFFRFKFDDDTAKSSWGGDGKIDYPIKFDSFLYDRGSGGSSGTLYLDELVAISGPADLYALKFGSKLAYWKMNGSASGSICGKQLNFTESVQLTDSGGCSGWQSSVASSSPSSSTTSSPAPSPTKTTTAPSPTTATPAKQIAKDKSAVAVDKSQATANGADTITISIKLRTSDDQLVKSSSLTTTVSGSDNSVSDPTLVNNDHYEVKLTSKKAEDKEIKVVAGGVTFDPVKVSFIQPVFSLDKSTLVVDHPTAVVGDSLTATLQLKDDQGNPLPVGSWQVVATPADLVQIDGGGQVTGDHVSLKMLKPGRLTINAMVDGKKLTQPDLVVYGLNPSPTYVSLAPDQIQAVNMASAEPLALTGYTGQTAGFELTNLPDQGIDHLIVKIESTPRYFWFTKTESGTYRGVVELPAEQGLHTFTVLKEDATGAQTVLKTATLTLTEAVAPTKTSTYRSMTWLYTLIVAVLAVAAAAGIGLWRVKHGLTLWPQRVKPTK